MGRISLALLVFFTVGVGYVPASDPSDPSDPSDASAVQDTVVSFSRDVFPIFEARCLKCHGGTDETGEVIIEAGLNLTTYERMMVGSEFGTVVEPGDAEASILIEMIAVGDMPYEEDPLEVGQIEVITRWIAQGAANN